MTFSFSLALRLPEPRPGFPLPEPPPGREGYPQGSATFPGQIGAQSRGKTKSPRLLLQNGRTEGLFGASIGRSDCRNRRWKSSPDSPASAQLRRGRRRGNVDTPQTSVALDQPWSRATLYRLSWKRRLSLISGMPARADGRVCQVCAVDRVRRAAWRRPSATLGTRTDHKTAEFAQDMKKTRQVSRAQ